MEKWLDNMLNSKISKEAMESQGTDKQDHFDRKVKAHDWIKGVSELDPVAIEAEYIAKLKQEAMILGKTAALDDVIADGTTPEEVVNRDYKRDVSSLSDYALAEMLAEAWGHKAQNTNEMFYELKEKAKKEVAGSREKAEKSLLELIPDNSQLDWQKAFKEFTKDAIPAEPKEKDIFKSTVPEASHNFDKPSEEKFKLPKDADKALPGNGREVGERTDVTTEAGVLKADIVEGISKDASQKEAAKEHTEDCVDANDDTSVMKGKCICPKDKAEKEAHCGSCPGDPGVKETAAVTDEASVDKDAASNQAVIDSFISGQGGAKSMNLTIVQNKNGLMLVNYETPIAFKSAGGDLFLNFDKYSVTTSKIQNQIARASGGKVKQVSAAELETIMRDPAASAAPVAEPVAEKKADGPSASDNCPVCGSEGTDLNNGQMDHLSCQACGITYGDQEIKSCASLDSKKAGAHEAWDVFLNGKEIDTVFYTKDPNRTAEDVKRSLVNHDGYDGNIVVKKGSQEIKSQASKAEVIKIIKQAEVNSPWQVVVDPETGAECIARVDAENKNVKESEESKEDELQK